MRLWNDSFKDGEVVDPCDMLEKRFENFKGEKSHREMKCPAFATCFGPSAYYCRFYLYLYFVYIIAVVVVVVVDDVVVVLFILYVVLVVVRSLVIGRTISMKRYWNL